MSRSSGLLFALPVVVVTATLGGCPTHAPTSVTVRSADASVDVTLQPFRYVVKDASGAAIFDSVQDAAGRYAALSAGHDNWTEKVVLSPGWDAYVENVEGWHAFTKGTLGAHDDDDATIALVDDDGHEATLTISVQGRRVRLSAAVKTGAVARENLDKLSLGFVVDADDHFFGGGERFGPLDHRGECLYAWAEEGGLGRGEDTPVGVENPAPNGRSMTYFPVPFFPSTAGWGAHLDTTRRTEACFAAERQDAGRFTVNGSTLDVVLYVSEAPLQMLDLYTEDTGRPMIPAPWAWGPRRRVNMFARVTSPALGIDNELEHELLRRFKVPTTGMDDALHLLPARSELGREPEILEWTAAAHEWGYKVFAYNNPYISTSIASGEEDRAFGAANGLFLLDSSGQPGETFFISGTGQTLATIDLTNPAGVSWFQDLLRRSLALGYDGWMHDFGEYTERDWTAFDGSNGEVLHNLFPVLSAKAAHDLLELERPDDYMFFVRSGYSGTQQYAPMVWGGDAESTFDESQGIPSAFRSGLSLAMSGVPYWGSDTTGFKCLTDFPRDKEVYLRWAALSATSPMFMHQDACVGIGSPDKHTLWADQETVDVYGKMARLHTRLQPYFRVLAEEAHASGAPLLRHPFLLAPKDDASIAVEDAWFLGDALYVAPVIRRGLESRLVYFPPLSNHGPSAVGAGRYVDLDTFAVHAGGSESEVLTPLDRLPLFLTENRILPLLDDEVETLGQSDRPDVIDVADKAGVLDAIVVLGDSGSARLTLADGTVLTATVEDGADDELAALVDREAQENAASNTRQGPLETLTVHGASSTASSVHVNGVTVAHKGAPAPLLVRWTVLRL